MAPSSCIDINAGQKTHLLHIARASITQGLTTARALQVDSGECQGILGETLASFVTLTQNGALRGCIGSLQASRPLAQDVAHAAFAAAFQDPRFPPLTKAELDFTQLDISVLSPSQPIPACSKKELFAVLRPQQDGLILEDRSHRATFLPKVWEQLPEPAKFLRHLLLKAGLPDDYWSDNLRFRRYQTCSFSEPPASENHKA